RCANDSETVDMMPFTLRPAAVCSRSSCRYYIRDAQVRCPRREVIASRLNPAATPSQTSAMAAVQSRLCAPLAPVLEHSTRCHGSGVVGWGFDSLGLSQVPFRGPRLFVFRHDAPSLRA